MAGHGELEPAAERVAMNRGDDRLRCVLDILQDRVERLGSLERLLARRHRLEDVDVGACHERLAGADEHDRLDGRVVDPSCDRGLDAFQHAGAERVDRRVVDRDDGDAVATSYQSRAHYDDQSITSWRPRSTIECRVDVYDDYSRVWTPDRVPRGTSAGPCSLESLSRAPARRRWLREILFANQHIPQPEPGFGARVHVRVSLGGFAERDDRALLVAAAQHPPRPSRHPGIDDVVDPGACHFGAHVVAGCS